LKQVITPAFEKEKKEKQERKKQARPFFNDIPYGKVR